MPSASSALAASLGAASQREKKAQGRLERALKERDEYAERAEEAGKLVAELSYANKRLSKEIADAEAAARAARERQVRACRYLQRGLESYEEASAAAFERAAQQLQRVVGALSALQAASGAGSAGGGAHAAARHLADAFAAAAALGQLLVPPRAQPPEDTDPDPQPSATGRGSGGAVESGEGSCAGGCGCGCSCCGSGVELRARVAVLSSQLEDARFEADEMARRMAELLAQADRGGFSGSASSRSGDGGGGEGMQSARTVDAKAAAEAAAAAQQQAEALAALASAQADVQAAQEELEELRRAHTAAAGAAESLRQRNASLKRALAARDAELDAANQELESLQSSLARELGECVQLVAERPATAQRHEAAMQGDPARRIGGGGGGWGWDEWEGGGSPWRGTRGAAARPRSASTGLGGLGRGGWAVHGSSDGVGAGVALGEVAALDAEIAAAERRLQDAAARLGGARR